MGTLDAHLLLHIFLPPLIFESAFAIEWHIFEQLKWRCGWPQVASDRAPPVLRGPSERSGPLRPSGGGPPEAL